jgi:rSAM-associated Gly-rich repeat protein
MSLRGPTLKALSLLLPAGALGISVALASTQAEALGASNLNPASAATPGEGIASRLQMIRAGVSAINEAAAAEAKGDPNILRAWWANGGPGRWHAWGNGGGWRNGGWRNGGWGNGGGWRNGGWGNGWPNFWHNW